MFNMPEVKQLSSYERLMKLVEQNKEIKELQARIEELEFKNECLSGFLKEADTKETVVDLAEYREPHSVINTGEAVHVMPTSVVNQIKAEGIEEMLHELKSSESFDSHHVSWLRICQYVQQLREKDNE